MRLSVKTVLFLLLVSMTGCASLINGWFWSDEKRAQWGATGATGGAATEPGMKEAEVVIDGYSSGGSIDQKTYDLRSISDMGVLPTREVEAYLDNALKQGGYTKKEFKPHFRILMRINNNLHSEETTHMKPKYTWTGGGTAKVNDRHNHEIGTVDLPSSQEIYDMRVINDRENSLGIVLHIYAIDAQKPFRSPDPYENTAWEIKLIGMTRELDYRSLFPYMIAAGFPHFEKNTNGILRVKINNLDSIYRKLVGLAPLNY